jgi:uncharacterized protein YggE
MRRVLFVALILTCSLQAQIVTRPSIQATGTATVSAPPDQATIDASVFATGASAQEAASKNATQVANLLGALGKVLGTSAVINTTNYYVYPNYQSSPPFTTITGYTASATVRAILSDLTQAGAMIDTAVASGASSVSGISFSLKDSEPQRRQALQMATQQALTHANAMAIGAGHTVGMVRTIQEGVPTAITPIYIAGAGAGPGAGGGSQTPTPVQPGTIQVTATVTVTADLN